MIDTIWTYLQDNWGNILALCGVFGVGLEMAPVKLKPISWILQRAGHVMNSELIKKVDNLERDFRNFKKEGDMEKINDIRKEIVDFSLSCQRQEHHTRDEFDRIFDRVDKYHDLLKNYAMENGKIDIEVSYINAVYSECLKENRFFMG